MTRTTRLLIAVLALGMSVAGLARGGDIKTYRLSVNALDAEPVVAAAVAGPTGKGEGNGPSAISTPSISADGSLVAFDSAATNLEAPRVLSGAVLADTNGVPDIFVHDVRTRLNRRVSIGPGGVEANGPSRNPVLTGDGTAVIFESDASNLVLGDTNGVTDIFRADLRTGVVSLVSRGFDGIPANGASRDPAVDFDGDRIAFVSDATNLEMSDGNAHADVFVVLDDRWTFLLSVGAANEPANGPSSEPSLSPDGAVLAFASEASNLVPGDDNGLQDVFAVEGLYGLPIRLLSRGQDGGANGPSRAPSVGGSAPAGVGWSPLIAFESDASNLDASDTNGTTDIFVADAYGAGPYLVTRGANAQSLNGASTAPAASLTGVAFVTKGLGSTGQALPEIYFMAFRSPGQFEPVSGGARGSDGASHAPAISADGLLIAYGSDATNLVPDDTNGVRDVFARVDERRCANGATEDGAVSSSAHYLEDHMGRASWVGHSASCLAALYGL
jgi:hypothetical protein